MLGNFPVTFFCLLSALFSLVFGLLALRSGGWTNKRLVTTWGFVPLLFAIVWRVLLSGQGYELDVDAQTFQAWGSAVARMGTHGLYESEMMIDYPPLYLWVLGLFSWMQFFLGFDYGSPATARLFHMGPLLADLVFAGLLSVWLVRQTNGGPFGRELWGRRAIWMASLILVPVFVAGASLFGQVDAIPLVLVYGSALFLARSFERDRRDGVDAGKARGIFGRWGFCPSEKNLALGMSLFTLACLAKPIAILFGPLGLLMALSRHRPLPILKAGSVSLVLLLSVLAVAAGFRPETMLAILSIYGGTLVSYPYVTLNAANVYGLFGLNWRDATQPVLFGLTWIVWGKCVLGLSVGLSAVAAIRDLKKRQTRAELLESVLFFGGLCLTLIFVFVDQMHERYLFVGAGLLLAAVCVRPSPRGITLAAWSVLLSALNQTLFLDFHARTGGYHVPGDTLWLAGLGAGHVLLAVALLWSAWRRDWIGRRVSWPVVMGRSWGEGFGALDAVEGPSEKHLQETMEDFARTHPQSKARQTRSSLSLPGWLPLQPFSQWTPLRRGEGWGLALLVLICGVFGFYRLGTQQSPETFWRANGLEDTTRVYRLDPPVSETPRVSAFLGLGRGTFHVDLSKDGETWTPVGHVGHSTIFDVIEWSEMTPTSELDGQPHTLLRVRFEGVASSSGQASALSSSLDLHELVVRTPTETQILAEAKVSAVSEDEESAHVGLVLAARGQAKEQVSGQGEGDGGHDTRPVLLKPVTERLWGADSFSRAASDGTDPELSPASDPLVDEQDTFVTEPDSRHGMIFDEVYHVRSAWEEIQGDAISETSHPPFGKTLIGAGMSLFGFHPWAWRVTGVTLGLGLIVLVFVCTRLLTGGGVAPLLAAWFVAFDFMRYTQTRLATLDGVAVFFVLLVFALLLLYGRALLTGARLPVRVLLLTATAVTLGLGVASKWSVLYFAPVTGLLILYWGLCEAASPGRLRGSTESPSSVDFDRLMGWLSRDGLVAFILFLTLPLACYFGAFALTSWRTGSEVSLEFFWGVQKAMYTYHSELNATHPFSSPWWEWPFVLRPLWVYASEIDAEAGSEVQSIVAMGHPLLWWAAPLALGLALIKSFKPSGSAYLILVVAGLGLYLPWVVSPRSLTFIYHFFPVVPFLVMVQAILLSEKAKTHRSPYVLFPAAAVLVLFLVFFPALSGMPVTRGYIDGWLRWIPSWVF